MAAFKFGRWLRPEEAAIGFYEGMHVVRNAHLPEFMPKMKLAPGDYVSDEMRAKTDAWLLEFFGRERYLLRAGNTIYAHPNTVSQILATIEMKT